MRRRGEGYDSLDRAAPGIWPLALLTRRRARRTSTGAASREVGIGNVGLLTILGLGPGAPVHLTLEAREVLAGAREVHLRTRRHPVVASLGEGLDLHSFDDLYDRSDSFEAVYEEIARQVLELARRDVGVVYAVPGHPLVGEESVRRILATAREAGQPVRVVAGLSFLEPALVALGLDPLESGLQVLDATAVASERGPFAGSYRPFDPTSPALLGQLYGKRLASAVKLALLDMYPPEHPATLVRAAGIPGEEATWTVPLHQLDWQDAIDHLTCLYIPPLAPLDDLKGFETLRRIVARLRAPEGCPWDREQTHETLKRYVIEEAYEVVDALDEGDRSKLREELGDLLLQVVLQAQLAVEYDEFTLEEVIEEIGAKLIRRHPHVFGDREVKDADEVLRNWDQIKKAERALSGQRPSVLSGVPKALPALERAQTVQRRVGRTGFDWRGMEPVLAKVREEVGELEAATSPGRQQAELGDLLFALVGVARKLDVDAEEALRLATRRFERRFEALDRRREAMGQDFTDLSIAAIKALWEEAKAEVGE